MNSNVYQSPQVTQRGVSIKGTARGSTIVVTQVGSKDTMDSIKAQIAALRQSCELVASTLEVASVTGGPLDELTDTSTLRRMMTCAMILHQEVRQLTEAGISHFQFILEQSCTTVEKIAQVLRPRINQDVLLFLKESPEKITEVTDTALLNVLLLHLQVMIAAGRLIAGGKHVTYYNDLLQDLVEKVNEASRGLVRKPSLLVFSQPGPPPSPSSPLTPTLPLGLLSPPPPSYSSSVTAKTKGAVGTKKRDVRSSEKMYNWKLLFLSGLCGTPNKEDFVVPTIPRPLFPENIVGTHIATLGAEQTFTIHRPPPPKSLLSRQSSNASLQLEDITEEAAAKAVTTFFKYTMTPKDGWHIVDVTRENVKEEDLRSQVNSVKDVQRAKSKLEQHKRRQVDQLMAALNGRESNRSFQWYPNAIIRERKSLVVIVERGPKAGLQASVVYKAVMTTPTSFAPGPPPGLQVRSAPSRPKDSRACSNNTEERSGCHIIMLACEDALGWVETSNGPASA